MKLKELMAVIDMECTSYIEVWDGTKHIEPEDAYDMEVVDFAPTSYEEYDLDNGHSLWTNNGIEITVKR